MEMFTHVFEFFNKSTFQKFSMQYKVIWLTGNIQITKVVLPSFGQKN